MQKLTASDGCWLTNGEIYGTVIYLPDSADISIWAEVTDEEKQTAMAEKEAAEKAAFAAAMAKRFGGGTK